MDEDFNMENASPWMLRVVLDFKKKEDKGVRNREIAATINKDFEGLLTCIFNNDNATPPVLQIRITSDEVQTLFALRSLTMLHTL